MSDGPFRSLPMRRGWQDLAERADNSNFDADEIGSALAPALRQDWTEECGPELLAGIDRVVAAASQGHLFGGEDVAIDALRRIAAGFPLRGLIVDCLGQTLADDGLAGDAAKAEAVASALADWSLRSARGVEEHGLRENLNRSCAVNARQRIEAAIAQTSFEGLARQLLVLNPAPVPRTPPKLGGLDDGVPINGAR